MSIQIYKICSASKAENYFNCKWHGTAKCINYSRYGELCTQQCTKPLNLYQGAFSQDPATWIFFVKIIDPGNGLWRAWRTHHICTFYMFTLCVQVVEFVEYDCHSILDHYYYNILLSCNGIGRTSMKSWWRCSLSWPVFHLSETWLISISFQ